MALGTVGALFLTFGLHDRSDLSAAAPYQPASSAVVFVLQGTGPDDLKLGRTPNIRALAQRGVTYSNAWVGQVEAVPTTSNATIATGAYPRETGLVAPVWRDPKSGGLAQPSDPQQVLQGSLGKVLQTSGVTPLARLVKNRYKGSRVLSVGGEGCAAASAAGTWVADYVLCPTRNGAVWTAGGLSSQPPPPGAIGDPSWRARAPSGNNLAPAVEGWYQGQQDDWIARYAIWAMRQTHPRLTVINFPEIGLLAQYVPAPQRQQVISQLVTGVDRDIGRVVAAVKKEGDYKRTIFVVTSDRATSPVVARLNMSDLQRAVFEAGGQSVYAIADTSAAIGLRDPLQALPVAQALQQDRTAGIDAVYYKIKAGSGWAYQAQYLNPDLASGFDDAIGYLLWTVTSSTSPDVMVVYAPGTSTTHRAGPFVSSGGSMGMQWENQHIPLIISGEGLEVGSISSYPARLVDIGPTLATLMDLHPPRVDGVVLADGMISPRPADVVRQRKTEEWLSPLTTVLKGRERQSNQ
jgi:arylsulfatase A-like enzyme